MTYVGFGVALIFPYSTSFRQVILFVILLDHACDTKLRKVLHGVQPQMLWALGECVHSL